MPVCGGLVVWRPYEQLARPVQQAMARATATAVQLAGTGEITARGTLGRYLAREPHRDVYEGDRRAWEWKQATAELDAMIGQARTDPEAARRVLVMFTAASRTFVGFTASASTSSVSASQTSSCPIIARSAAPTSAPES